MRGLVLFVTGITVGVAVQTAVAQNVGLVGLNHVGMNVPNIEETVAFYTQKMEFREAFRTTDDRGQPALVFIQLSRNTFLELGQANAQRPAGFTHYGIQVENMGSAVKMFQQRGLMVTEPRLSPTVKSTQASITDPNSIRIELTEFGPDALQRKAIESWK